MKNIKLLFGLIEEGEYASSASSSFSSAISPSEAEPPSSFSVEAMNTIK